MLADIIKQGGFEYFSSGFQADVHRNSAGDVLKVTGLHPNDCILEEQADWLAVHVSCYYEYCRDLGLRIPAGFSCSVHYDQPCQRWVLVEQERFAGMSVAEWLTRDPFPSLDLIATVVQAIMDQLLIVFATVDNRGYTTVGFDPKVANFTLGTNQTISYVDFMPPRYQDNGDFVIEYLGPMEAAEKAFFIQRYFTPLGQLKIFLIQLSRCMPLARPIAVTLINDRLRDSGLTSLADSLCALPSLRFKDRTDTHLFEAIDPSDPDSIRDLACQVASLNGRNGTAPMKEIFNLTHLDVRCGSMIEPQQLAAIQRHLHQLLQGA